MIITLCIKQNIQYIFHLSYIPKQKDNSQGIKFAFYLSHVQISRYEKYGLHHIDDMNDVICDMIIKKLRYQLLIIIDVSIFYSIIYL